MRAFVHRRSLSWSVASSSVRNGRGSGVHEWPPSQHSVPKRSAHLSEPPERPRRNSHSVSYRRRFSRRLATRTTLTARGDELAVTRPPNSFATIIRSASTSNSDHCGRRRFPPSRFGVIVSEPEPSAPRPSRSCRVTRALPAGAWTWRRDRTRPQANAATASGQVRPAAARNRLMASRSIRLPSVLADAAGSRRRGEGEPAAVGDEQAGDGQPL